MTDTFKKKYSNKPELKDLSDEIKLHAQSLLEHIQIIEKSREQSIAITKLEECVMWAVKAIYIEADKNE